MTYKYKSKWRTGKEIDESINRAIFELQAQHYNWKRTLSIKPRRCYWTGNLIRPFSYAMVCHPCIKVLSDIENAMDAIYAEEQQKKFHVYKWISLKSYTYLKLAGRLK